MELTCTIANANEYPLLWVRLGDGEERNFPISHGQNLFIKTSQKFKLDSDDAAGTYTLKIKNIQPSDDATYQCQLVTTTEDMITADVKLQVQMNEKRKERALGLGLVLGEKVARISHAVLLINECSYYPRSRPRPLSSPVRRGHHVMFASPQPRGRS